MESRRTRILISALLAAALFAVGYSMGLLVPGGGDVKPEDFTDFYDSDSDMSVVVVLLYVLLAGCLSVVWLFAELKSTIANGVLRDVAFAAASIGAAAVAVGGVLLAAPSSVQLFSDAEFVGVEIAHTFAQAGFGVMLLVGMLSFALAIALVSVDGWRAGLAPRWLWVAGFIVALLMIAAILWVPGYVFPIWLALIGIFYPRENAEVAPR
jgi:hypothetical protein